MMQEDVTLLPYTKFCSHTSCLKFAFILGPNNVCTVWSFFFKHSRAFSLEKCKFISCLKYSRSTTWEKGVCICELQKVFCARWACYVIVLLIEIWYCCFLSSEVLGKKTFLFSPERWQYIKKPLREENVIICVQEQLLEPVYSCS